MTPFLSSQYSAFYLYQKICLLCLSMYRVVNLLKRRYLPSFHVRIALVIYVLTVCFHNVFPGCLVSLPCGALGLKIIAVRIGNQSSLDRYWILLVPEHMERANVFCGSGRQTSGKCGVLVWITEELVKTFKAKCSFLLFF